MIDAVSGDAKSQRAHGGNGGFTTRTVGHHAGHGLDVAPPSAVLFPSDDDWNRFQGGVVHWSLGFIIVWGECAGVGAFCRLDWQSDPPGPIQVVMLDVTHKLTYAEK